MSEKTTVQLLLEQRFQELAKERRSNNEVPEDLHQEVFQTLQATDLFAARKEAERTTAPPTSEEE